MTKIEQIESLFSDVESLIKTHFKNTNIVAESEKLGLYYQDVSAWVHGRRKWSLDKVLKIAKMLDKSVFM